MIQRIQTIYMVLSVILIISFTFTPSFTEGVLFPLKWLSFLLTLSLTVSGTLSLLSIFFYKKRPLQSKLILIAMICLVIALASSIATYISSGIPDFKIFGDYVGIILLLIGWISLLLARMGIIKDEKLIKSMDRIR